ncbi:hypothetical protein [Jiella mangrovi]|uniref:hypothetical protein n=1 Tax=Jiella mangrovi TaxID=2821407 RepID=UPI001FD7F4F5|nr:hypothetical protein [Jiella mangrovi]
MPWKKPKNEPQPPAGAMSAPGTALSRDDRPSGAEAKVRRALLQLRDGGFLPTPDHAAGSAALGAGALGAGAVGALALGAFAVGAVAVGAFAIGRLSVGRAQIGDAEIRRLRIGRLEVESFVPPIRRGG